MVYGTELVTLVNGKALHLLEGFKNCPNTLVLLNANTADLGKCLKNI